MAQVEQNPATVGSRAQRISNAIVRLHREYYGRGATTASTIIQRNYVVTFLNDVFTPVERTLLEAGEGQQIVNTRLAFQRAMEQRFTTAVEEVMEREVIAFMSQVHLEPDIAAEIFVLKPEAADAQPEIADGRFDAVSGAKG